MQLYKSVQNYIIYRLDIIGVTNKIAKIEKKIAELRSYYTE